MGRPTSIRTGGGAVFNHSYTYDNVGNVLTNVDVLNGQTQNYQYDHRDRLGHAWTTGAATAGYDHTLGYDVLGNITSKPTLTNAPETFAYNPSGASSVRPHAVTQRGADSYAYDGNGNLTSRAGKALVWNADNTLASMVGPDNVPEGYTYDPAGNRLTRSRNLGQPGGVTVVTLEGGLWEEDVPTGDTRSNY